MNISIFLKGKEFHIVCGEIEDIYSESETRNLADNIPLFIDCVISKIQLNNLENLIYSSGPCSFTSIRIINSIVKAFAISFSKIKFLGVSHFLTYLCALNNKYQNGLIAIPTMRGDYFTTQFSDNKLNKINIKKVSTENSCLNSVTIFEDSTCFSSINLAKTQLLLLNTDIVSLNPQFLNSDFHIEYGFTPENTH